MDKQDAPLGVFRINQPNDLVHQNHAKDNLTFLVILPSDCKTQGRRPVSCCGAMESKQSKSCYKLSASDVEY